MMLALEIIGGLLGLVLVGFVIVLIVVIFFADYSK